MLRRRGRGNGVDPLGVPTVCHLVSRPNEKEIPELRWEIGSGNWIRPLEVSILAAVRNLAPEWFVQIKQQATENCGIDLKRARQGPFFFTPKKIDEKNEKWGQILVGLVCQIGQLTRCQG